MWPATAPSRPPNELAEQLIPIELFVVPAALEPLMQPPKLRALFLGSMRSIRAGIAVDAT